MKTIQGGEAQTRLLLAFALCAALPAHACWDEAAARYHLNSAVLYAIAQTESSLNPLAVGQNPNGSRDIGLMQINSAWLPKLAEYGISERDLFQPCTSIHVGAWLLARNIYRYGYTWEAVGAYNAVSPSKRSAYVKKVQRNLRAGAAKRTGPSGKPAKPRSDSKPLETEGRLK